MIDKDSAPQPYDILLVDDDVVLREALAEVLESAGYRVLMAAEVDAALKGLGEVGGLRAAVVDVRMPGIEGPTLAETLKLVMPALPIVMMTGDPVRAMMLRQSQLSHIPVLVKPFAPEELLGILAERLTAERHALPPRARSAREPYS